MYIGEKIINAVSNKSVNSFGERDVKYILLGNEEWIDLISNSYFKQFVTLDVQEEQEYNTFMGYKLLRVMQKNFFDVV